MRTGTGQAKNKPESVSSLPKRDDIAPTAPGVRGGADVQTPSHDEIAALAFEYWEMRAGLGGSAEDDWLRAEEALRERLRNTEDYRSSTSVGGDLNQFNPRSRTLG